MKNFTSAILVLVVLLAACTPAPTATPLPAPTATVTTTITPLPTATMTNTPTLTATSTQTNTPTLTAIPKPSVTSTRTPSDVGIITDQRIQQTIDKKIGFSSLSADEITILRGLLTSIAKNFPYGLTPNDIDALALKYGGYSARDNWNKRFSYLDFDKTMTALLPKNIDELFSGSRQVFFRPTLSATEDTSWGNYTVAFKLPRDLTVRKDKEATVLKEFFATNNVRRLSEEFITTQEGRRQIGPKDSVAFGEKMSFLVTLAYYAKNADRLPDVQVYLKVYAERAMGDGFDSSGNPN